MEAKRLGLNNYSRLKKQELIDLLRNQRTPPIEPITKKIPAPTKKIEMSPKELENKIKRLKKKLREINQKRKTGILINNS